MMQIADTPTLKKEDRPRSIGKEKQQKKEIFIGVGLLPSLTAGRLHIDVIGAADSPYTGLVTLHPTQLNPIKSSLAVAVGGVSAYACSHAHSGRAGDLAERSASHRQRLTQWVP
jgi:hypothetical protein